MCVKKEVPTGNNLLEDAELEEDLGRAVRAGGVVAIREGPGQHAVARRGHQGQEEDTTSTYGRYLVYAKMY